MYDKCENQRRYEGESIIFLGERPFKDVQLLSVLLITFSLFFIFSLVISFPLNVSGKCWVSSCTVWQSSVHWLIPSGHKPVCAFICSRGAVSGSGRHIYWIDLRL